MTEETAAPLGQVCRAVEQANQLLKLQPEEWCGGPVDPAPVRSVLRKRRQAAEAPDTLEKQMTLLSSELEAANLGLRDLISACVAIAQFDYEPALTVGPSAYLAMVQLDYVLKHLQRGAEIQRMRSSLYLSVYRRLQSYHARSRGSPRSSSRSPS